MGRAAEPGVNGQVTCLVKPRADPPGQEVREVNRGEKCL